MKKFNDQHRNYMIKSINVGHGRGLVRGLLGVMGEKEGATGGTSLPPTNFHQISNIEYQKFPPC